MRPIFLTILAVTAIWASCSVVLGSDVEYSRASWNGVPVHVVTANLNSPDLKVTVSLAKGGPGSSESFSSMLKRTGPAAAITGTFFCTRSLLPTGDIIIEGMPVYTGCLGKGVCITPYNTVEFVPYRQGHLSRWQGFETVLCAGPTLVQDGRILLFPRDEGFSDPNLFGKKKRTAIGVTDMNRLLMVVVDTPVHLRTLAKIMVHLGAVEAVDLDGGSSSALYCDGRRISAPGRSLTNLLVVYDNETDYFEHRQALAPQFRDTCFADSDINKELTRTAVLGSPAEDYFKSEVQPAGYLYGDWNIQSKDEHEIRLHSIDIIPDMDDHAPVSNTVVPIDVTPNLPDNSCFSPGDATARYRLGKPRGSNLPQI